MCLYNVTPPPIMHVLSWSPTETTRFCVDKKGDPKYLPETHMAPQYQLFAASWWILIKVRALPVHNIDVSEDALWILIKVRALPIHDTDVSGCLMDTDQSEGIAHSWHWCHPLQFDSSSHLPGKQSLVGAEKGITWIYIMCYICLTRLYPICYYYIITFECNLYFWLI